MTHDPTIAHGALESSERTRLRRHPERGLADRASLHAILDAALIVHVGVASAHGPRVLPMAIGRIGDTLYLHGAVANALLGAAGDVCVTATLVDGLVLAQSAFHHSMNYRCAVIFGPLREVTGDAEKRAALDAVVDHALPGRSAEARPPSPAELRATRVAAIALAEASVKVRVGPPAADPEELTFSGVLPLRTAASPVDVQREGPSAALERALLERAPRLEGSLSVDGVVIDPDPRRLDLGRVLRWIRDESYWGGGLTSESLRRSLAGAFLVGAYDRSGAQIAVARVVSDEVTIAWLGDVFVDRDHRGRAVGRALVRFCVEHPRLAGVRKWILGTADAHALYRELGFELAPEGRYMLRGSPTPAPAHPAPGRGEGHA